MNVIFSARLWFFCILALLTATVVSADDCIDCHKLKTPAVVRLWQESAHSNAQVGCRDCHGEDHGLIEKGKAHVDAKVCGKCHEKAFTEHVGSRHGMGLHSGWGCTRNLAKQDPRECSFCHEKGSTIPRSTVECARFLKQSNEMSEIGCNRCHQIEKSCASCHTSHSTDLRLVRDPAVCASCHMGPDHPQWEMWQTSRHGVLNFSQGSKMGPGCQTCHMPKGSHDVSLGLTMSTGGMPFPPAEAKKGRTEMLAICTGCHASDFAIREFARGDAVRDQSLALVKEAEGIIAALNDEGALLPMPENRPPHPLFGNQLVLDSQMLYEDISHIERLFFKMKKYDLAKTIKGAYHQNAAYTHWYGNAELKMGLVDIKSEAVRLRERKEIDKNIQSPVDRQNIEGQMNALKKKAARGAITPEEHELERARLLKEFIDLK